MSVQSYNDSGKLKYKYSVYDSKSRTSFNAGGFNSAEDAQYDLDLTLGIIKSEKGEQKTRLTGGEIKLVLLVIAFILLISFVCLASSIYEITGTMSLF